MYHAQHLDSCLLKNLNALYWPDGVNSRLSRFHQTALINDSYCAYAH
jgi:hypothetical protein